jgi:hypothetical protein
MMAATTRFFVGQIERATIRDGEPLVYFLGNYRKLAIN